MRTLIMTVVVLACGAAAWALAQEGKEKEKAPSAEVFTGKVVVLYTGGEFSHAMRDAQFKEIAGRRCLTGAAAPVIGLGEWFKGTPIAVPWDAVTTYMLMTDEQYEKFLEGEAAADSDARAVSRPIHPLHPPVRRSPVQ